MRAAGLALTLLLPLLSLPTVASTATAATTTKTVRYRGFSVRVPRSWPVYDLSADPATCVRFNRHAVYLGTPSAKQSCPVQSIGRTEAVLLEPAAAAGKLGLTGENVARRVSHGVAATATWNRSPAVIERALRFSSMRAMAASAPATPAPARLSSAHTSTSTGAARVAAASTPGASTPAASTPGEVYEGKGFDVCSTPSGSDMSAWGSSPYHAVGVYIGGVNRACSQPNLTSTWVGQESADGWHLIPIYVGLQAPSNDCGCKGISASSAASEGKGAASTAVADAEAIGIGTGNPLYFDMEGYDRTSANSSAVLAFLDGWTDELHADGYLSGVYSSGSSGVADLVSEWGTSYPEPDELWVADWNGEATASDPAYVPSDEWADNQLLHQYSGGVDQSYGGVELNIDKDYLDAATAAAGSGVSAASAPPASGAVPTIKGYAYAGQTLHEHHGYWSGSPTSYGYQWYRCAGSSCTAIHGASAQSYKVQAADVGDTLEVAETASNALGAGVPATSAATATVRPVPGSSYWLYTAHGNVYNGLDAPFYGSAVRSRLSTIAGMALTPDHRGYWLVDAAGSVFSYGNAAKLAAIHPAHPIIGAVAAPHGGLYLLTAYGNVYALGGAKFHGSPSHRRLASVSGMAVTTNGKGYWVVDQAGQVFAYGDAAKLAGVKASYPVRGVVAASGGGIWLWTAHGNIYNLGGARFYNSPIHQHRKVSTIAGMAQSAKGKGYWMVKSGGRVFEYGSAAQLPTIRPGHPVIGLAGPS